MTDTITRIVIACYRPHPGKEEVLLSEVRDHHPLLRSEGLATDRRPVLMRAADGTLIEIFEWASPAAIQEAHENARVQEMWERFAKCCDYVPLGGLSEAGSVFSEFEAVRIGFPPLPEVDPDHREE